VGQGLPDPRAKGNKNGGRTLCSRINRGSAVAMGRPTRADEAGGIDHALNRGPARTTLFHHPQVERSEHPRSPAPNRTVHPDRGA
jgi:hypothetical protein